MKKFILNIILILIVSIQGYSQTGLGYVNYKAVRTHYGNGNTSQYPQFPQNSAQFDRMLDLTNPANTLIKTGEVVSDSNQGFAGGNPSGVGGDYYVVEFTGWFYAELTGNYLFYSYSDDSAEIWVGGSLLVGKYNGPGTASKWITLQAGTWYPLKYRWQEFGGGAFGYLQVLGPRNGYFYPGGANAIYKVSNQEPVYPHKLDVTYNFGNNLDKTKFNTTINFPSLNTSTTSRNLSSNGVINYDESNGIDPTLYTSGKKATTIGGQTEWCVIYPYDATNKRYRVGIDSREFTNQQPNWDDVKSLQLFDLWDGPVTPKSGDNTSSVHWNEYYIYTDNQINFSNSTYSSNIRAMSYGDYALQAEFSFEDINSFTTHEIVLGVDNNYWSNQNIISIQDIAIAFNELAGASGPNPGSGGKFTTGIEYVLADINKDGNFDFQDTQLMLQHLFGDTDPFESETFTDKLRMFEGGYDNWDGNNWSSNIPTTNKFIHTLDENNKEKSKSVDIAFLGDVNFSHSHIPTNLTTSAKISNMSIGLFKTEQSHENIIFDIEKENDILKVTITIPNNIKNISGSQFRVNFNNSKLEYVESKFSNTTISNFSTARNNYVNIGSFSSDGYQNLNGGMVYELVFKSKYDLNNTLGLITIPFYELVNKDGNKINLNIR
jgi:hypothetical protein